jgi:hypothetical protein
MGMVLIHADGIHEKEVQTPTVLHCQILPEEKHVL